MARKPREQVTAAEPAVELVDASAELVDGTPDRGEVPRVAPAVAVEPPVAPKRFRVVQGGAVIHRGFMSQMRPGKVLSETDYDVKALREQGVLLEEVLG